MGDRAEFAGRLAVGVVVGGAVGLAVRFVSSSWDAPVTCEDTWHTKDHIKVTCENGSRLRVLPTGDIACECPTDAGAR